MTNTGHVLSRDELMNIATNVVHLLVR